MKLAVVIAAFDERPNVEPLLERLDRALAAHRGRRDLLFVVDGEDGTREAIEALAQRIPDVRVLHAREPRGLADAFRRGFEALAPDVDRVVTLDADLNHQPEEIPRLLAALETSGADVVVGSRDVAGAEIVGIPRWKRVLSRLVNSALGRLTGCPASDKTSGFRVYRGDALRRLRVRSGGYSFLADLLLQASALGMKIHEEPIRFVYRVAGRSKLPFARTSLDYVRLLGASASRADRAFLLWLAAGFALRLLLTYPAHRWYAEGDASLTGLGALRILDGEPLVFFNGVRIGAVGCWLAAALFSIFGAGRETLAAVALLFDLGTLVAGALFLRELLGRERAVLGLPLLALAPPAVSLWTCMPVGYAEQIFTGALTLWLAARVVRRGATVGRSAALGAAAGLAFWTSLLTVCLVAPALVWAGVRRPGLRRAPAFAALVAGFALGSLPWWIFNLAHGFPSVRGHLAAGAATDGAGPVENLAYTLGVRLPDLLARTQTLRAYLGDGALRDAIRVAVLALWALLAVLAVVARRRAAGSDGTATAGPAAPTEDPERDAAALALAIVGTTLLVNALSGAGAPRVQTERYVLPVFLALPLVAALARGAAGLRRRIAGAIVALLVAFDLAAALGPWHPTRRRFAAEAREDERLIDRLRAEGVEALGGSYDQVYAFNFLSGETLFGLPVEERWDAREVGRRLPDRPLRWALLAHGRAGKEALSECGSALLPQGKLEPHGAGRWLWRGGELAERGPTAADELARVRSRCAALGRPDAAL